MTKKEKQAFREGVEEGYVKAVEQFRKHLPKVLCFAAHEASAMTLSAFRPTSPTFKTNVTGRA